MSQESEVRKETLQLCEQINEKCEIDPSSFNYDILKTRNWYIQILQILCPYLVDELSLARKQKAQSNAINQILQLINSLDQFNEDVTEAIQGDSVVLGDSVQIYYMVQVFAALLEQAMKDQEYPDQQSENRQEKSQKDKNQPQQNPFSNYLTNKNKATKSQQLQKSERQGNRSVIGIRHQFQQSQDSQQQSEFQIKNQNFHKGIAPTITDYNKKYENQNLESQSQQNQQNIYGESESRQHTLEQKLSQTKMNKIKRNPEYKQKDLYGKKRKKLVQHPKIGQKLQKAKSAQAIKITQQITNNLKSSHKKIPKQTNNMNSPTTATIKKKAKQLQYYNNDYHTHKKVIKATKNKRKGTIAKTDANLNKLLNWRKQKLKQQQKDYEQSLKMKLQNKKQIYVRRVNNIVMNLQKQKAIDEKKQFKQKLIQDNNKAVKRLAALQKFYQDRLSILKQDKNKNRVQRNLVSSGHKEIINQIQKQLKKDNEQKIMKMTQRYRQQSEFIQSDLEDLEKKIIMAYKKY